MDDRLTLIGFEYSVYTRIVRMALVEMGLVAGYVEVDPFSEVPDPELSLNTPFARVPVLRHGAFTLTETSAIVGYLSDLSPRQLLRPKSAQVRARMRQVIGVIDAYGYHPMIRDVFSHGFYRPHMGEAFDPDNVTQGLRRSRPVLTALDGIAQEGLQLNGRDISLADIHLGPMFAYCTMVPDAAKLLTEFPALSVWWSSIQNRSSLNSTDPFGA